MQAMGWQLWRQDDHGNEFLIEPFDDRLGAEAARDALAARGHHQHYWVTPVDQEPRVVDSP